MAFFNPNVIPWDTNGTSDNSGAPLAPNWSPQPQSPAWTTNYLSPGGVPEQFNQNTGQAPTTGTVSNGYLQLDPNDPSKLALNANGSPWTPTGPGTAGGATTTGGAGGGGGQTSTGGIFNPNYYTGFSGQAPGDFSSYLGKYPMPTLPQWQGPAIPQAPAFSYADFKAPTLDEAKNQPGYQFGVDQGLQALQQSRAAQGLLRTGGTLKDIQQYGQNAATQNYGNVLNQDLGIYNTNRAGAVQTYNTNYQTQYQDPYKAQFADAQAKYAPQLLQYQTQAADAERQAEFGYNSDWAKYLNQQDVFYNNQSQPFQKYLSLANIGAGNA